MVKLNEHTAQRLLQLIDWHEMQAKYPVDVSGSDRTRAQRKRFHSDAAADIRSAVENTMSVHDDYMDGNHGTDQDLVVRRNKIREAILRACRSHDKLIEPAFLVGIVRELERELSNICTQPHLGLATNQQLLDELRARIEVHFPGGLSYRTVQAATSIDDTDGTMSQSQRGR